MKALRRPTSLSVTFALLVGALFFLPSPAAAADTTVAAGDFYFCSQDFESATCTTTVNAGDTVTWSFSGAVHTTTSNDGVWDSGTVQPGGTFAHTFAQAGSFSYFCQVHPGLMMGTIVVQAPAAATSTPPPSGGETPASGDTPAAGATSTAMGGLPASGQGPQSGGPPPSGSDWLLLAALAIVGVAFTGGAVTLYRRTR